jgi:16S rRNA (adenine1518-N6/adenine1519-N6)-dimethyltransferase
MTHRAPPHRRARPPLGQHFLRDETVCARILGLLRCRPEDCWLEIGAGHGEMTLALAQAGGLLAAVERDTKLAPGLRTLLRRWPRARVVEGDILDVSLPALAEEMGCPRLRVYGNLPYYITSPILQHLFGSINVIADIHVMVQEEVAHRLVAAPGGRDYGYLSVLTQWHTIPEILLSVSRGAFQPPPKVESALVRLTPPGKGTALDLGRPEEFFRFVGACFRQKRKTLRNNLRVSYPAPQVEAALAEAGLDPRARAEELPLDQFAQLCQLLDEPDPMFSHPKRKV